MAGWVKLHRCLLEKATWKDSTLEQKTILVTLLLMANHSEKSWVWKGKKFTAKPGQFVTSLEKIAAACGSGLTNQNVRTALAKFEKLKFLTNESTNTGRLITIVNWGLYQEKEDEANKQSNRQLTDHQQTANKQHNTYQEDKKDKKDKNDKEDLSKGESGDEIPHSLRLQKYISEQLGVFCLAHTDLGIIKTFADRIDRDELNPLLLDAAIKHSAKNGARSASYIYKVLSGWESRGIRAPDEINGARKERDAVEDVPILNFDRYKS